MSPDPDRTGTTVRLQKLLAEAGAGSRRAVDRQLGEGGVLLNGRPATPGDQAKEGDLLQLGERRWKVISATPKHQCLVYNKPLGEVTTRSDPQGRPTVFDRLPAPAEGRWVSVGRLDINTTGLLLLTTDGDLANAMMHPSRQVDREYVCRVLGSLTPESIERLKQGVELDDGPARFSDIVAGGGSGANQWYQVTLLEGRNREVRRLFETQGVKVSRLKRVRYGALFLPKHLRMGQYRALTATDHRVLREDVGLPRAPERLALKPVGGKPGKTPRRGRKGGAPNKNRRPARR